MHSSGYTLIELLIVISIIGILAVVGFVNFKDFSSKQVAVKAAGQVQSALRLAQSNATSSTFCGNLRGVSWSLIFRADQRNIDLACGPTNIIQKTYTLENAEIRSITGSSSGCNGGSVQVTYGVGVGALTFSDPNPINSCISTSNSLTITVHNQNDTSQSKIITISKGGTINVQ